MARLLTQTAERSVATTAYVAVSVTWRSSWRGTPANVIETMYQPTGRARGSCTHRGPSVSSWIASEAATTRGSPVVGTGGAVVTIVQSGALAIADQAAIAAVMSGRRWTVAGTDVGSVEPSGTSVQTLNAARSRGVASTRVSRSQTRTSERRTASVSKRTVYGVASASPVPGRGSPGLMVTV